MTSLAEVRAQGGLAYGLRLAQGSARGLPIWIVPWVFVPAGQLNQTAIADVSSRLGPVVLRWSEAKPGEFTPTVRRGDKHRQIIWVPTGASHSELRCLALAARSAMPKAAVGAILQRAIGVSQGCLVDIEIADGSVDLEFRTATARRLVHIKDRDPEVESVGTDTRIPSQARVVSFIRNLVTMVGRLPSSPTGWHIEGAFVPDDPRFAVMQLRPTPADRPLTRSEHPLCPLSQTRLVWGVFDVAVDLDAGYAISAGGAAVALHVRDRFVERMESGVVAALKSGTPVLLLNRASGFRMTHESFNLPVTHLRDYFCAAHLPATVPRRFRVVSDGDSACFARV